MGAVPGLPALGAAPDEVTAVHMSLVPALKAGFVQVRLTRVLEFGRTPAAPPQLQVPSDSLLQAQGLVPCAEAEWAQPVDLSSLAEAGRTTAVVSHSPENCTVSRAGSGGGQGAVLPALLQPSIAIMPARVERRVLDTGLHREVVYKATATIPDLHSAPGHTCFAAIQQRLERTAYVDLDELREVQRVGGPDFASHTHYIDVERPASASTQHEVFWIFPLPVVRHGTPNWTEAAEAWAASQWLPLSVADHHAPSDYAVTAASPWAVQAARQMLNSSLTATQSGMRVDAQLRFPIHVRYQSAGCAAGDAGDASGLFRVPTPREDATVLPLFGSCYAGVHLPMPTVHIQCGDSPWQALATHSSAWPPASTRGLPAGFPSPAHPQQPGTSIPPLVPVPVGIAWQLNVVSTLTAALTLCGAALVAAAGWWGSAPLR